MTRDKSPFTPLKDVIKNLFSNGTLPIDPEDGRLWEVWDEVMGPAISRHARPSWIKKGNLRVTVSDPIWLQELQFMESEMRERLNRRLGREAVHRIEFRVGNL